jgi:lipoprotein-anchoring transpeptidase ErfK/SrfK
MTLALKSSLAAAALLAFAAFAPAQANVGPSDFNGVVLVPPGASDAPAPAAQIAPGFTRGTLVDFATSKPAGSIVVVTKSNRLYYVLGDGKAVMFRVATAKRGFGWAGTHAVSIKKKWPDWRPPASMRKRKPELPAYMAGGPDNPLGARAIYLGSTIYRIHGTNDPSSIGKAASSGCIRMLNADVTELFKHVKIGASVTVI